MPNLSLHNADCLEAMKDMEDNQFDLTEMQVGKAGEYIVCADLITKGFIAYPSEQGLPYDVVLDAFGAMIKVQVKTTRTHKRTPQRVTNINTYSFNVKRRGRHNKNSHSEHTCHLFAFVALDEKQVGYIVNKEVKQTMFFRVESLRGTYRDENIKGKV